MAYLFEEIPFEENQRKQNSVADEVKFYLDVNYAEKLVLKDVAKEFGVHPNYMTRIFHEKFGISPKKYLMDLKLKKACHLLTTTSLSIGVIAGSLGKNKKKDQILLREEGIWPLYFFNGLLRTDLGAFSTAQTTVLLNFHRLL